LPFIPATRRQFLRWAAAASAVALAGDSILLEPNRPRIVRQDFFLPRWPKRMNGFTIALLSDFHYDPYFSAHPLHAAIAMVNGLRPDLIAFTGDFVSVPVLGDERKAAFAAEPCARLLHQMTATHGLWAVLGNHDDATDRRHVTAHSGLRTSRSLRISRRRSSTMVRASGSLA
jgi:predicted MPP superfamily phosphohydrolase